MKRKLRIVLITVLLVAAPLFMLAQTPPHPNGGNAPTPGNNGPVGGGAPIDGGLSILLLATLAFSVNRYYRMRKEVSVKE